MKATILIRVKSHRARDRMKSAIGDIGNNINAGFGLRDSGEYYAVNRDEWEKLSRIKGIAKARHPKGKLNVSWNMIDDHVSNQRSVKARIRLEEYQASKTTI